MGVSWFMPAMADTEKPDKRPNCDWLTNKGKPTEKKCGSEESLNRIVRRNWLGAKNEHNICDTHRNDALKKWNWESVDKPNPSRTTGV